VRLARERGEEFGSFGWRHEIAHPLTPPGKRQERLIADAILTYQANEKGASRFHYRFIEVDRANRPVDDLAAQIGCYGRLYRRPAEGRYAAAHWTRRYRVFPNVIVVLAGRPRPNLERRRTLLALCRADADLAQSPRAPGFRLPAARVGAGWPCGHDLPHGRRAGSPGRLARPGPGRATGIANAKTDRIRVKPDTMERDAREGAEDIPTAPKIAARSRSRDAAT
jgi:hypothetical protein